jgi:hypothetical protein
MQVDDVNNMTSPDNSDHLLSHQVQGQDICA